MREVEVEVDKPLYLGTVAWPPLRIESKRMRNRVVPGVNPSSLPASKQSAVVATSLPIPQGAAFHKTSYFPDKEIMRKFRYWS